MTLERSGEDTVLYCTVLYLYTFCTVLYRWCTGALVGPRTTAGCGTWVTWPHTARPPASARTPRRRNGTGCSQSKSHHFSEESWSVFFKNPLLPCMNPTKSSCTYLNAISYHPYVLLLTLFQVLPLDRKGYRI